MAVVHPDTGCTDTPKTPTGLTEVPLTVTAVDSTTPTLQAVYNNLCSGDPGQVDFEVLSMSGVNLGGCATGEVNPGTWAQCTYYSDPGNFFPGNGVPLQAGEEYQIEAISQSDEDGEPSSGSENGTFWVDARMGWGTESWMTNISWHPDSQMTVSTNVASGDLNISMSMLQAEAGVGLPIDMNFVSSAAQNGASGDPGKVAWDWTDTFGESLYVNPTGQSITYFAPDGQSAAFIAEYPGGPFNSPGDMPASLYATGGIGYQIVWNTADDSHAAGQVDSFNSTGQLVEEESDQGGTINITYNASNKPSTMTTSAGRTFDFNYYTSGALLGDLENIQEVGTTFEVQIGYNSGGYLDSVENPDSGITQFGYQTLNHQINTITTPAGRELLIGYDTATGTQVTSVAEQDSDFSTNPKWTFTYTPSSYVTGGGQCTSSETFKCGTTVAQDPNGHNTTYTWDNADRVTNTTDVNGQVQATTWNSDNNVTALTDPQNNNETFTWDPDSDVLDTITNPGESLDGSPVAGGQINFQWTSEFPETLHEVTDSTNPSSTLTYTYNTDGEVSEVQDGLPYGEDNTETATYEGIGGASCGGLEGGLCSITDFDGATTNYAYNSTGELTSITPPPPGFIGGTPIGSTTFGYNPLGQVSSEKDGRGDTTNYLWNGEGQIKKVTYQDSTNVQLNYDADGNLLSEAAPGGNSTFTYNPAGATKTSNINGDSTTYGYDPVGNLLTMNDSVIGNTTYNYTNVNELHQVMDPWGHTTTLAYESGNDELLQTISLPGSVTETYGYDSADRVTSFGVAHSGTNLISDTYDYFNSSGADANLLQSVDTTTPSGSTGANYGYDALERLAGAGEGETGYGYEYNGDGGITQTTVNATQNNLNLNQNNQNENNSYNAAGDLTSSSTIGALAYNPAGQTSSITPTGHSAQAISYLSDGQTLPANFGSTTIGYNALGTDSTTNGSATNKFLRTPDGTLLADYTSGAPNYYIIDPTGSVVGLTNTSGTQVDAYSYDPYGNVLTHTGTVSNPFGYESGYNVPNTDLLHFGERYYDPSSETWTQLDPTGQNSGYAYAGDDPVNASDPSGEVSKFQTLRCLFAVLRAFEVCGDINLPYEPLEPTPLAQAFKTAEGLGEVGADVVEGLLDDAEGGLGDLVDL